MRGPRSVPPSRSYTSVQNDEQSNAADQSAEYLGHAPVLTEEAYRSPSPRSMATRMPIEAAGHRPDRQRLASSESHGTDAHHAFVDSYFDNGMGLSHGSLPYEPTYDGNSVMDPLTNPMLARNGEAEQYKNDSLDALSYPGVSEDFGIHRPSASMLDFHEGWEQRQRPPSHGQLRKFELRGGNWIVDYPVPSPITNAVEPMFREQGQPKEFTHVRYSAVTCDPDQFTRDNGWGLRTCTDYGRDTELLITLTYYNEDRKLLARTLYGVMQNIRDICRSRSSKYWRQTAEDGRPAWQRIVVVLVYDGIDPCDKETLDVLATIGVYQDGIMKRKVDDTETVAHLFEYTTQVAVDSTPKLVQPSPGSDSNLVPVQMIFCMKQKNSKKINSHRWVFNAIGSLLQPEVVVLIDVGTKPGVRSIYHLWEAFYNNPNLGGACGEIHVMTDHGVRLLNPLVAAQNFEYKISNILDKPLESTFGYVSVLPGAFSAYRYRAICGRPLQQYFHGDHTMAERLGRKGMNQMNIFRKNMFLAEDRILCFELVAKAGDKWVLSYVKPSKAETDVPEKTAELISQRRRWLNGSFAASIYSLVHFYRLYRSRHNLLRMLGFHLQAIYNTCQLILSWFALGNLWLTFAIIIQYLPNVLLRDYSDTWLIAFHWINLALMWVYGFMLALQFVLALGNRPKAERVAYILSLIVFGVLGTYVLCISLWLTIQSLLSLHAKNQSYAEIIFSNTTAVLIASLAAMFGVYLVASVLYADPWHMVTSSIQYFWLAPSFVNVINVYAFCNLHDVSWGTKGSDKADALPSVDLAKRRSLHAKAVVEEMAYDQDTIDERFHGVVKRAIRPYRKESPVEKSNLDDSNRTFRTRLVALWLFTNAALVAAIMNLYSYHPHEGLQQEASEGQTNQQIYFKVILWSTFGMAAFRFIGFLLYWIQRQIFRWFRKS
ncbi:chitin synthase [Malassezia yamatoensis]|uniref:Chitin synthase n=1 Tax=Malassezia yamatoensis TaxID=253288 RepID=A0AAJ5YZJ1_9BASI|nr:chitin synthase [Malassezia yamatoensis]